MFNLNNLLHLSSLSVKRTLHFEGTTHSMFTVFLDDEEYYLICDHDRPVCDFTTAHICKTVARNIKTIHAFYDDEPYGSQWREAYQMDECNLDSDIATVLAHQRDMAKKFCEQFDTSIRQLIETLALGGFDE